MLIGAIRLHNFKPLRMQELSVIVAIKEDGSEKFAVACAGCQEVGTPLLQFRTACEIRVVKGSTDNRLHLTHNSFLYHPLVEVEKCKSSVKDKNKTKLGSITK